MLVHLVYPHDPARIAAPWSIGNHVAHGLRLLGYEVRHYDWAGPQIATPTGPEDVLLGHPHPERGPFLSSLHAPWRKRVALCPFNGSEGGRKFMASWIDDVDHFLAICGPHWAPMLPANASAVDMAVDRDKYPRTTSFTEPGKRSIAYVGCCVRDKGTDYLAEISMRLTAPVYHFGFGACVGRIQDMGYHDFARGVPPMDFIISTGRNDANPTSLLEGASWGMLAFCTPESGWGEDVAIHVPLDRAAEAAAIVNRWLAAPVEELEARRATVDAELPRYSWDAFVARVAEAIA